METKKQQNTRRLGILAAAHHDYGKALNSFAFFKVNNRSSSEDLVQDTFLKTWRYIVKGGKINMMKAFLFHVLNGLIVDEYRKHKTSSLDVLVEKGFDPEDSHPSNLLDVLDGKAAILLIGQLPEKYQKVMRMKYVQDLSLKEMSLITGQSQNAISVQLHRGLKKLQLLYHRK